MRLLLGFFCWVMCTHNVVHGASAPSAPQVPALLKADTVSYDTETDVITATGNVTITKEDLILRADTVTYNKKTKDMHAHGRVWYKEKTGDIYFAEHVDFSKETEHGFAKDIQGIMLDNAKLAARTGQKIGNKRVIFVNGVYSPCETCKANPEFQPLWQIKANKIIHNKEEAIIEYHHARMEWHGFPFFYSPYFRHADGSVKRKSGLLKPEYGSSSDLGKYMSLPVYYAINNHSDATITPIFTSSQGTIFTGEYRHLFKSAFLFFHGSYTSSRTLNNLDKAAAPSSPNRPAHDRWHVFLYNRIHLDPDHLLTFDLNRASDTTYLRRYPVLPQGKTLEARQSVLTSYVGLERFKPTHYASIEAFAFQTDNHKRAPFITPLVNFEYESLPGRYQETWFATANILSLHRIDPIVDPASDIYGAADMNRLSLSGGFRVPYVSTWGDIWELKTALRWDYYGLKDFRTSPTVLTRLGEKKMTRFFPQASLKWSYPFVSYGSYAIWTVEPVVMISVAPQGGNQIKKAGVATPFPNEDSQISGLDPTSLFIMNRPYGLDRVDRGSRVAYGLHNKWYFSNNRKILLFVGQSRRLDRRRVLSIYSGETTRQSHLITDTCFVPHERMFVRNRLMLDGKDLAVRISESSLGIDWGLIKTSATHAYINKKMLTVERPLSQLRWSMTTKPFRGFSLSFSETRNLKPFKDPVSLRKEKHYFTRSAGLSYENECLRATLALTRTTFNYQDIKPSTTVALVIDFKNLGTINPLSFIGNPFNSGGAAPVSSTP